MKIAILYICTGQYICFWNDFYKSLEEKFIAEVKKDYFVFTDAESLFGENINPRIHKIYQENLGWPGNTLFRFKFFTKIINELNKFDYIFFMNANIICNKKISAEEFLPNKDEILVVQHPGYFNVKPYEYPYDRNRRSNAYVSYFCGKYYVCGGVNGGTRDTYISLIIELNNRIDRDYKNGVIAAWHDESQLNRYIIDHTNYRLLSPAYCYPEGWVIPFEQKIIVRDKNKYFDTTIVKRDVVSKKTSIFIRILRKILVWLAKFFYYLHMRCIR